MRLLIVGGSGVLSSAVAKEAVNNNFHVTLINRGHRFIPNNCHLIKSDKDDYVTIAKALKGQVFDAVIDFLCYNEEQTKRSFLFYKEFVKQYIFISTCAVYDKTILGIKSEDSPKGLKLWSYSLNKVACEESVLTLSKNTSTAVTIVRPCVTYDDTRIPYGIMPPYRFHWTLCARVLADKPIITWNNGMNRSNMMRVEDFAIGLIGLVGNRFSYNEAFNICGDEMPTFNDVLDVISKKLGKEVRKINIDSDFFANNYPEKKEEILGGRALDATNSNEKIKRVVPAFAQKIPLSEGVSMTIDAYRNNNYQKGIDWEFDGTTDRIISLWCKKQGIKQHACVHFVDYLGNASCLDRMKYLLAYYSDWKIVRFIKKICKKYL